MALISVQESFKMKPHLINKPGVESSFTFDSAWEKAQRGELVNLDGLSDEELPRVEKLIKDTEQVTLVDPPQA